MRDFESLERSSVPVRVIDVAKGYGNGLNRVEVLSGVRAEIRAGECVFLVGPSGCGKTTLLSILGCLHRPDGGRVELLGTDVFAEGESDRAAFRRRHIGFIFQKFHLFEALSARENLRIVADLIGEGPGLTDQAADELLASVGLREAAAASVRTLSTGQRQRVAFARGLVADPEIILADEPTASLDEANGRLAVEMLVRLAHDRGRAVIVVTHDDRILDLADRILRLDRGRLTGGDGSGSAPEISPPDPPRNTNVEVCHA